VKGYQLDRITSYIHQEERLVKQVQKDGTIKMVSNKDQIQQVKYAKEAITLGRWTGSGFGEGLRTSSGDIPEQRTDFIFSAIGEQFGLLGAGALLTLYLIILLRIIRIAQIAPDHVGSLIAAGAATLLVWHVFENAGMNMGLTPVTGIPLPLVSFGGSSAIAFLSVVGLVQNVHMRRYTQV
jgi:rod shape determining protein RodA